MHDGSEVVESETLTETAVKRKRSERRPPTLRILRALPMVVVLGLLVHFVLPRLGTIESSFRTLQTMVPWAIALAVLAQALSYAANGGVLQSVVRLAGERISLRRCVTIELGAGSVALVAAGALGFGAAIYKWTRDGGVSAHTAMLASWLPSLFDAATLVLFALLSAVELLLAHHLARSTVIALSIVVSLLGILITGALVLLARADWMMALAVRMSRLVQRVLPRVRPGTLIDAAERAGEAGRTMHGGGWVRPACSSFLVLAFDLLCLRFVFLAAGQHIPLTMLIAGYGVPMLLGRSSFLPGGIAVTEVAMAALYGGLGVAANVAVVVVLVYRLIAFWIPAAVGVPIAIALHSRRTS
jgi:uncharacterized protein (TIRG00374 family)